MFLPCQTQYTMVKLIQINTIKLIIQNQNFFGPSGTFVWKIQDTFLSKLVKKRNFICLVCIFNENLV